MARYDIEIHRATFTQPTQVVVRISGTEDTGSLASAIENAIKAGLGSQPAPDETPKAAS